MDKPEDPSAAAGLPPPPPRSARSTVTASLPATAQAAVQQQYHQLLDSERSELVGYARFLSRDSYLAEDLVQDATLKVWVSITDGAVEAEQVSKGYLKKAVRSAFLDFLRSSKRRAERDQKVGMSWAREWEGDDPGERFFDSDIFRQARELLPDRHWTIFVLSEGFGLPAREIGESLRLKPATVSNYLSSARKVLLEAFARPTRS